MSKVEKIFVQLKGGDKEECSLVLAKHFDDVADANFAKRGGGVQVDLQRARARFLRGDTNIPPGNASNFNRASLGE